MPKILVADDNSNIQKMVALALKDLGIEVVSVGNGEAAVRKLTELHPDLVLADVFMPVRSGYEVCEFVKKDARFAHIPVILLVGAFDPLDEKEAQRVGADGVLKKPFVPPEPLIALVRSTLGKASPEHAAAQPRKPPEPPRSPVQDFHFRQTSGDTAELEIEEFSPQPTPIIFRDDEKPTAFGELLEMPPTPPSIEPEPGAPEPDLLADFWRVTEETKPRETPGPAAGETGSEASKPVKDEPSGFSGFPAPEAAPEPPSWLNEPAPAPDTEPSAPASGMGFRPPPWSAPAASYPFTSSPEHAETEPTPPKTEPAEEAPPSAEVIGFPQASQPEADRVSEAPSAEQEPELENLSPEQRSLPLPIYEVEIPEELEVAARNEARAAAEAEASARGTQPDPALLEAVVQRVMAQLQPHILDLVSQNVIRPVVTALLQRELDKKEE